LFLYGSVLFASLVQDNLVNSLCHLTRVGYANFDVGDRSRNFWLLGYFGWGQGWHNNHHALPAKFDFGVKWWEFDPCRLWLPFLKLFGATARVEKTNGIA
jgi:stearoyl-CoA desaturase (delta-9 desaturase)